MKLDLRGATLEQPADLSIASGIDLTGAKLTVPKTTVGDVAKGVGAGLISDRVGGALEGGGQFIAQGINRASRKLTGRDPQLRAINPLKPVGDALLDSRTEGGKLAADLSRISGDITDPSTYNFGEAPSIGGMIQNLAPAIGQLGGQVLLAAATRGKAAPSIAAGGLTASGFGGGEERQRIEQMPDAELTALPSYQQYRAEGLDHNTARMRVEQDAELGGATGALAPGLIEGAVIPKVLSGKTGMPSIGTSRPTQIATAGLLGGAGELAQEVSEGIGQRLGANLATGTETSLTEDSLANAALGFGAGSVVGAGIKALQSGQRENLPIVDPLAAQEAKRQQSIGDLTVAAATNPAAGPLTRTVGLNPEASVIAGAPDPLGERVPASPGKAKSLDGEFRSFQRDQANSARLNQSLDEMNVANAQTRLARESAQRPLPLPAPPPENDVVDAEIVSQGPIPQPQGKQPAALPSPDREKPGAALVQGKDGTRRQTYSEAAESGKLIEAADSISGKATGFKATVREIRNPKTDEPWNNALAPSAYLKKMGAESADFELKKVGNKQWILSLKNQDSAPVQDNGEAANGKVRTTQVAPAGDGRQGDQAVGGPRDLQADEGPETRGTGADAGLPVAGVRETVPVGTAEPIATPALTPKVAVPMQDQGGEPSQGAGGSRPTPASPNTVESEAGPVEGAATTRAGQDVTTPASDAAPTSAPETVYRTKLADGAARHKAAQKETHEIVAAKGGFVLTEKSAESDQGNYDFKTRYPKVPANIARGLAENGRDFPDTDEQLKATHDEWVKEWSGRLSDAAHIRDSLARDVDPTTDKPFKTDMKRKAVERALKDITQDQADSEAEYENYFGDSNLKAFKAHVEGKKPAKKAVSTAPEHEGIDQGLNEKDLKKMVKEFNEFQVSSQSGEQVTHIFDPPTKNEIVRLADKVKVYHKDHGWMTSAEAKEKIAEWKANAAAQGESGVNANKIVLSLFDLTGKWSQPWAEAGYQVYQFDIQDDSTYEDPETGEERKVGDVHNMSVDYFNDLFGSFDGNDVHAILAACPCTDFAVSGARHFAAKDADGRTVSSVKLVHQTLAVIEYFKPAVWAIENPVGRIEALGGLPPWRLSFDPNHIGDSYTKKTLIWGRFNADLPIAPVEPTEGSKMHTQYGGKSLATKNARSATPEGFAYGFFQANNAVDNPLLAVANKYDRLDRNAIKAALDAGITPEQISSAVDDLYYQDLDDDAANEALRALVGEKSTDAESARDKNLASFKADDGQAATRKTERPKSTKVNRAKKSAAPKTASEFADSARKSLLAEIRQMGGINQREMQDITGEGRTTKVGGQIRALFTKNGVDLDRVRERMAEIGYFPADGDVTGDLSQVREIIRAALNGDGEATLTPSERETYDEMKNDERAAADDAAAIHDLNEQEKQHLAIQYEADSLLDEDTLMALAERHQEDQTYYAALQEAINVKRKQDESNGGGQDDEETRGREAGEAQGRAEPARADEQEVTPQLELQQQTEQQLRDQAERISAIEREQAAQRKAAEDRAAADKERDNFSLTGSDRPADVAMAGGQSSMFGAMGQPASSSNGFHEREKGLSAKARAKEQPGDVILTDGKFAPFNEAVSATRELVESGQMRPWPAQVMLNLGIGLRDAQRVLDAAQTEIADKAANAESKPQQTGPAKTPLQIADDAIAGARDGTVTPEKFKAAFAQVIDGEAAIREELNAKTKDDLLGNLGAVGQYRLKNAKKAEIVDSVYETLINEFALGKSYGPNSYSMGQLAKYEADRRAALKQLVAGQTAESLAEYAAEMKKASEEAAGRRAERMEALKNPKTIDEFRDFMGVQMRDGKSQRDARLALTPDQRAEFDRLLAEKSRAGRKASQDAEREIRVAGQKVDATVIATKHTKKGNDLFVVRLGERVPREDYDTLNTAAKRMGGYYSSFRGAGATPGFQFTERATAEAFVKLANGDAAAANEAAQTRRDAFADDRSQTAVERLIEMADRLEQRADEALSVERKANTERRARMAASAESAANSDKAMARTMRNIAKAITSGDAKFLDLVRQKVQVEMLEAAVRSAKDDELRSKFDSYAEQQKRKGEPATSDTIEFANFPSFTMYRSDLASLARQLEDVEGLKLIGSRLMKVADDVSEEYTKFAKENWQKVSPYTINDGRAAIIPNREAAEDAIRRAGLRGKAIVLPLGKGKNAIVMSPSEAMARGIWQGDGDKRISLKREIGAEIVEKLKGRRDVQAPWQFVSANDRLKALARMGIETPAEFRSALREFIGLRERAIEADRVKQMERAMIGRKNDGLDFFPTPATVADEMIEAAGIEPDMTVLEPSAGMGHIADRIRAAGAEPDVIEMSGDRRELLEAKGFTVIERDFMDLSPRDSFLYGDVFRDKDGIEGVLGPNAGLGSDRFKFYIGGDKQTFEWRSRDDLTGVRKNGIGSGYDRIVMNPPFSDGRDMIHVRHAYDLLKPGGRLVAIMGEGAFFRDNKQAREFREWLESVGGTDEKLAEGSFLDPTLPVNTSVNARMVVIEKPAGNESENDGVSFRLSGSKDGAMSFDQVELTVKNMLAKWENAPPVVVLRSMIDPKAPQIARDTYAAQQRGGTKGVPRGFIYKGVVYIVADTQQSPKRVVETVFHEALGHYGLRGVFGQELTGVLRQVATMRKEQVDAKMKQYGFQNTESERLRAAEEVLAEMAEKSPDAGFVKRAIAAIRSFLRKLGLNLMLSDNDITATFLLPARRFVESGERQIQAGAPAFSLKGKYGSDRSDWGDFPPVHRMAPLKSAEKNPQDYAAAKAGDADAAYRVIQATITEDGIAALRKSLGDKKPIIVPVVAQERTGRNALPMAYAEVLGARLGLPVSLDIIQSVRAFHTDANAYQRIASQPSFDGAVEAGKDYLIVDDTQAIGGTLTNLRGHIEANGGNVILASALTGHALTADIKLRPEMKQKLLAKHGKPLDDYLHETFGFGIERLTQGEAGHLAAAVSLDAIRDRIAESRRTLGIESSEGTDSPGQSGRQVLGDLPDFSLASSAPAIRQKVGDFLDTKRTFNDWWHKTVGTQYHKAQVDKDYGRVFNRGQEYLTDVSRLALGAADSAPDILPRFESLKDLAKSGASPRELKPVADAIFRGTLEDEKVYSDDELRTRYQLNPKQIRLYRQARAAIDRSLEDTAITEMVQLVRKDVSETVVRSASAAGTMRAARNVLADALEGNDSLIAQLDQRVGRVEQLKDKGYAPLMRFGRYSVYVTSEQGEQLYYGMFEDEADARRTEREMREQYPKANIQRGVVSEESYKMFRGITPDTAELFADVAGFSENEAVQQYLKIAVNNRSALKRLIQRKGIDGYNPDLKRVLAQFITSNARVGSGNLHQGEMLKAWEAIPKEKGDVKDEAARLIGYVREPQEEAQRLRSFLFFNFLGGSVASAAVNMTQPVMMSFPYLSQWGAGRAAAELGKAVKAVNLSNITDPALRAAMDRAIKSGVVEPHQIFELQGAAMNAGADWGPADKAREALNKATFVWGRLFSWAEQFNRRLTFAAAFQIGRRLDAASLEKAGVKDAYEFAIKAINETQGVYNRGNRPDWARGAVGATLFTFKQFSISYLEFLKRLPRKQQLLSIGVMVMAAGMNGLPGADDMDDLIDTLMQALGYSWNTKEERQRLISGAVAPILGEGASEFVQNGVSTFLPIDIQGRLGMGNLLPGTGIGLRSQENKGREIVEAIGPAGALVEDIGTGIGLATQAARAVASGDLASAGSAVGSAFKEAGPVALQNLAKAIEMTEYGFYRDTKGRRVIDTDAADAAFKAIGFQPVAVARESREVQLQNQNIQLSKAVEADIADLWAQGIFEKNPEKVESARNQLMDWNSKNPKRKIQIVPNQIQRRVKEMQTTRAQRFIKRAPMELREEVSNAL